MTSNQRKTVVDSFFFNYIVGITLGIENYRDFKSLINSTNEMAI